MSQILITFFVNFMSFFFFGWRLKKCESVSFVMREGKNDVSYIICFGRPKKNPLQSKLKLKCSCFKKVNSMATKLKAVVIFNSSNTNLSEIIELCICNNRYYIIATTIGCNLSQIANKIKQEERAYIKESCSSYPIPLSHLKT